MNLRYLDLLRGLAALAVFIGHLRSAMFQPYANGGNLVLKFFYFITGFGYQAVIVFFVLSGFFITKSINDAITRGRWSFANYGIDRVTRLWIVLIPALLITIAADMIGTNVVPDSPGYSGNLRYLPDTDPRGKSSPDVLLGNLFFLQGIAVPTFGSNGPLWSLANEFWYYVTFPLLLFSLRRDYGVLRRGLFLMGGIMVLVFVGTTIAMYFTIWLLGAGAYYASQLYKRSRFPLSVFSILVFLGVISMLRVGKLTGFYGDFILGLASAWMILELAAVTSINRYLESIASYLSKISYTLYACHMPIVILLCSLLVGDPTTWSFRAILEYLTLLASILFLITVVWNCAERWTPNVKEIIKKRYLSNRS